MRYLLLLGLLLAESGLAQDLVLGPNLGIYQCQQTGWMQGVDVCPRATEALNKGLTEMRSRIMRSLGREDEGIYEIEVRWATRSCQWNLTGAKYRLEALLTYHVRVGPVLTLVSWNRTGTYGSCPSGHK